MWPRLRLGESVGSGNHGAAVGGDQAIAVFKPPMLVFVGIAGALSQDLSLGDVVVGSRIYAYHGGRVDPDGFKARPRAWEAPHFLVQVLVDKRFGYKAERFASGIFELTGASGTDTAVNLDRHWRNVRTHSLHDPARWKYVHLGNHTLNGTRPPRLGLVY